MQNKGKKKEKTPFSAKQMKKRKKHKDIIFFTRLKMRKEGKTPSTNVPYIVKAT